MTYCAFLIATASESLDWYSCGSVFGSVMILVTLTWIPPIWETKLPQKFSAATTLMTGPEEDPDAVRAAGGSASFMAAAGACGGTGRTAVDLAVAIDLDPIAGGGSGVLPLGPGGVDTEAPGAGGALRTYAA